MRYRAPLVATLFLAFVAGGCGGEANAVPDVEGKRLDLAQELLDDAGLGYDVIGGGDLGVIVRRNWQVCEQRPRPPRRAKSVELHVGRSCIGNVPDDFDYDEDDDDDF
jgi:hypothetical protein